MYKMNRIDPASLTLDIVKNHFENTLKPLTETFTDPSNELYKVCSPYAPFLAWGTQFYLLVV
jgi:hypothetical protein